jgi:hypothetical protein
MGKMMVGVAADNEKKDDQPVNIKSKSRVMENYSY